MLSFNWITFFGQGLNPDTARWKDRTQPPCTPCFPGSSGSLIFGNTLLALSTVKWKIAVLCKAPSVPEVLQRYFSSLIIYPRNCGVSVSLSDFLSFSHPPAISFSDIFLNFCLHLFPTLSLSLFLASSLSYILSLFTISLLPLLFLTFSFSLTFCLPLSPACSINLGCLSAGSQNTWV